MAKSFCCAGPELGFGTAPWLEHRAEG